MSNIKNKNIINNTNIMDNEKNMNNSNINNQYNQKNNTVSSYGVLYNALLDYTSKTISEDINIPLHMPGHKRNYEIADFVNPYKIDITEIDGFDNYHNPSEIIKECMDFATNVYKTKESIYLVNGSTVGILCAIYGCTNKGDKILVARNCHKAVYNAIFHQELNSTYIYPQIDSITGAYCGINQKEIDEMLKNDSSIKVVIITSPTYEGAISDITKISEIVHKHGGVLIVDEAHGAHLPLMDKFPTSAIYEGADVVIQSLHKLLPSLTQTAILHICSDNVDATKIHRYLSIYQSSSPSYVFLASMDSCVRFMSASDTQPLIGEYYNELLNVRERINSLKTIKLIDTYGDYAKDYDKSKLIIKSDVLGGQELYDILREKYKIQLEMASEKYVVAMTSLCDNFAHYDILYNALKEIDDTSIIDNINNIEVVNIELPRPTKAMTIFEAINSDHSSVHIDVSEGKIAYDYVYLYPPGSPILAPGEVISSDIIKKIKIYKDLGLNLIGLKEDNMIECISKYRLDKS